MRASSRAVTASRIALAVLLALLLTPSVAHAWTPGTHIFLGEAILRSLSLVPSSIAELLAAFPYDFLYGSRPQAGIVTRGMWGSRFTRPPTQRHCKLSR